MKQTPKTEALHKAQVLCSKKEYCKSELKNKFYQWRVDTKDFNWIIEHLEKDKFIDERRYVEFYVRDKFKLNKWGKSKIEYELKAKGIDYGLIMKNIDLIDTVDYEETCKKLITKKINSLKNEQNPSKLKEKTIRYVQSRGFEIDLVFRIYAKVHDGD